MNKDKTESRLAILVMILGQMCVSALRLDHKELAENEKDLEVIKKKKSMVRNAKLTEVLKEQVEEKDELH